ncbi:hypothetical protein AB0M57_04795 [Streptomyces sp. NPDC051597]|uniref:hypothetical protein n=1 Tax=Streptomyces sp. NPDC051597 TaxID=3155049 RepID=UPI00343AF363
MAISLGSVEVDVIPSTQGIYQRLRSGLVPAATRAGEDAGSAAGRAFGPAMQQQVGGVGLQIGAQIGSQIASRITAALRGAIRDGITQGGQTARPAATRQGDESGGAFARAMKARLEAAFRSLPKIKIDANTSEADADLQALRARMEALSGKRVGVDIDTATARAEVNDIEERLQRIGALHPNVAVRADTARAREELRAVRDEIDRISADPHRIRLETDGLLGQRMRAAIEKAEASLPNINIGADTTPAQAEITALRTRLSALKDQRIGIDIDAATAQAQLSDIQERLFRLSAQRASARVDADTGRARAALDAVTLQIDRLRGRTPTVDVRVDAAAAYAQLAAVRVMADSVDGHRVGIIPQVNAGQALSALFQLNVAIAAVAAIPAFPILAAGVGAFTSALVGAAVGVGVLAAVAVPAIVGIAGALQAQKAARDAATNAELKGGQAAGQGASKALQMAGAQQALASAYRNAARQISQAEQAVADAARSAAEANRQAGLQVRSAQESLAEAVQQAAERQVQAAGQVTQAERAVSDAQRTARQAQLDLTQARKDAAEQLEDLANRVADARLSERDAVLDVQDATNNLRAVQAKGASASELELQRAQLAYDQAVQRLAEQREQTRRLSDEKTRADKAGVEGSDLVKAAQQRLSDAQRGLADQQKALGKARADATKQELQSQKDIAKAQQKVAEAQRNVAKTQEDGARSVQRAQESLVAAQQSAADSIASAQRQIASASQQAAGGVDQAAIAQAKYQQALDKLSPSARATFDAFLRLRDAFKAWSPALQPAVMPLFTRALNGVRTSLPALTPLVYAAAKAVGELQDKASRGFKSPWWQTFKSDLETSLGPAIVGLGVAFGNVFKTIIGITDAFLPHMDSIANRMETITGRWATWAAGLKGSPSFERFLDYAARMGPTVARAIGDISSAFYQVAVALSPLSGPVLRILGALARGIASIAETLPWLVQGMYLAFVATRVWTIAMFLLNAVMDANPITLIILAVIALAAAFVYAYKHSETFRNIVQSTWDGIKAAVSGAWTGFLKPTFDGIATGLRAIGGWAMWLWQNVLSPVFSAISLAARILIVTVLTVLVGPWVIAFQLLAAIATWLWQTVLSPLFGAIGAAASWLWTNALAPFVTSTVGGFQRVGAAAAWLYTSGIKPAVDGIAAVAVWLWSNVIQPVVGWIVGRFQVLAGAAMWLWQTGISPAVHGIGDAFSWLWRSAVQPIFGWIADKASWLYDHGIKPPFDAMKSAVGLVASAFDKAKNDIKSAWDKVEDIARKPVQYVVDIVYNKGIRGVWNKIAGAFGAPELKEFTFASGGIMPGYTPGRDVHRFISPTGGALELSGGEAIMRPEFTRAVGSGFIGAMNSIARTGGTQGVKAALAPVFGGNPNLPTDRSLRYANGGVTQRFGDGGIFGWISDAGSALKGAGSAAWNGIKRGAQWLADTLEASARAGVKHVVDPLLASFPGMDTGIGKMIRRIPDKIIDALFGYSKKSDEKGAGGIGGPRIQAGLNWAKTQAGKPYQWAGDGNPSWDCSGFMSAIESVIRGQVPPHRRWATGAFSGTTAPPGWVLHGSSPFKIGITNAGVGHTAGTLGKTNVESRGGAGVLVGGAARGYDDSLFQDWYGFQPGQYDSGGYLQPGMNLAYNGTGRPEPVFTNQQANALLRQSTSPAAGGGVFEGDLYLDGGAFLGHVRGEVRQELAGLTSVLQARRGR